MWLHDIKSSGDEYVFQLLELYLYNEMADSWYLVSH